ncbi:WD40 repeat domain-containing protein [Actinomadura welshii]
MTSRDRAAASAGRGPLARWTGRRLFAAAGRGNGAAREAVVRIAATPGHRLRDRARAAVAVWWVRDRDAYLRQAVLDVGARAPEAPERLVTLALLGRLGTEWEPRDAGWAPYLLDDEDPDVRERTAAFCQEASGPMLGALWEAVFQWDPALRNVLLANGEAPPSTVLNGLWDEAMGQPSEPLWGALIRWGRPASAGRYEEFSVVALEPSPSVLNEPRYRRALITALAFGDHPLYEIAERRVLGLQSPDLVEEICARAMERPEYVPFCKKHRYAPKDEVRRASFFLLTGQPEQHRALDPDGALLSLAYASASQEERGRLQKAMLGAGQLDLVRVIVGEDRRARILAMSGHEMRYLGEQLAARREWEALWELVQDVPIASGIELARLFDGWVPRDDDSRRVFEMYREAGPRAVETALRSLKPGPMPLTRQARLLFRGRVNDVSFAPDGPFLAAAGTNRVAGVFDLRTARLIERYDGFNSSVGRILHTGAGTLIAGERTSRVERECRVVHCADGGVRTLHRTRGSVTSLAVRDRSGGFVAATRAGDLVLGGTGGEPVTSLPVSALGMGPAQWPRSVAAHPASGRIAVLGRGLVVTDAAAGRPVVASHDTGVARAAFVGADALVHADQWGYVAMTRLGDDRFAKRIHTLVPGLGGLAAAPGGGPTGSAGGEPVVVDRRGDLHIFDVGLDETCGYRPPRPQNPTDVTVSPNGDFVAVSDAAGHTDLFDLRIREVPGILPSPLVDLVPRHLGIVGSALAGDAMGPEAAPALRLLHACLEHRFRFDIEIGDAVRLSAGEHDISL